VSDATATGIARLILVAGSASVIAYGVLRRGRQPRVYGRSPLQLTPFAALLQVSLLGWHPIALVTPAPYDAVVRPLGLAAMLAGGTFGAWAALSMGRYWDAAISALPDHRVVESGPFRLVRHPIYLGVITLFIGAALATADPIGAAAAASSIPLFVARARAEERFLADRVGERYRAYAERVPMLLPWPRP
jgi:protein-S-isoprenylcysteine O-methyltransferase Ste14